RERVYLLRFSRRSDWDAGENCDEHQCDDRADSQAHAVADCGRIRNFQSRASADSGGFRRRSRGRQRGGESNREAWEGTGFGEASGGIFATDGGRGEGSEMKKANASADDRFVIIMAGGR